jgi:hypothetical protein
MSNKEGKAAQPVGGERKSMGLPYGTIACGAIKGESMKMEAHEGT